MLFEPLNIGRLVVRNRIVKSAMGEGMADAEGRPRPELIAQYERWARGGVGLAITGMAHVRHGHSFTGGEIGLYDDELIAPLSALPAAAHRHGGAVFAQLCHAPPQLPRAKARRLGCHAPSPGFNRTNLRFNRALSAEEIEALVEDFAAAARRARAAGFDGVQLHAAHGYLLSRFISPWHNRRDDAWGGDFERRLALLKAIHAAIRRATGDDFPLAIKLNAHDGRPGRAGTLDLATAVRIGRRLERWGFDAIEVSAGVAEVGLGFYPTRGDVPLDLGERFLRREFPFLRPVLPLYRRSLRRLGRRVAFDRERDEAYFFDEARAFAEALVIPVICVGGIRTLERARQIVEDSPVAAVALARPLVRQPNLPRAWSEGRKTAASCQSCNRCFVMVGLGHPLRCYSEKQPEEAS
jgi:2,4-dienoyl-CoA reductase-like NADH-dependent reductase (Old Yellow Enzyme family)